MLAAIDFFLLRFWRQSVPSIICPTAEAAVMVHIDDASQSKKTSMRWLTGTLIDDVGWIVNRLTQVLFFR
ncbi:MAG: hypothetical protein J0H89_00535, partial [Rhizobiales bacterium]|nr:hypothetical protein [Hyphomicrobiales bacterium]